MWTLAADVSVAPPGARGGPGRTGRNSRSPDAARTLQHGLIRALGIPPEDFFRIIHVLPPAQFLHTRSLLGLTYSDDLIVLEVTFISGRRKQKRLALLKGLNDGVVAAAGISPDALLITLYETPGENISFGRGLAQRAHISDTDPKNAKTCSALG